MNHLQKPAQLLLGGFFWLRVEPAAGFTSGGG